MVLCQKVEFGISKSKMMKLREVQIQDINKSTMCSKKVEEKKSIICQRVSPISVPSKTNKQIKRGNVIIVFATVVFAKFDIYKSQDMSLSKT